MSVGFREGISFFGELKKELSLEDMSQASLNWAILIVFTHTTYLLCIGNNKTRWWFQILFYVHPYLGKIPILTNMFQMG